MQRTLPITHGVVWWMCTSSSLAQLKRSNSLAITTPVTYLSVLWSTTIIEQGECLLFIATPDCEIFGEAFVRWYFRAADTDPVAMSHIPKRLAKNKISFTFIFDLVYKRTHKLEIWTCMSAQLHVWSISERFLIISTWFLKNKKKTEALSLDLGIFLVMQGGGVTRYASHATWLDGRHWRSVVSRAWMLVAQNRFGRFDAAAVRPAAVRQCCWRSGERCSWTRAVCFEKHKHLQMGHVMADLPKMPPQNSFRCRKIQCYETIDKNYPIPN